MATNMALPKIPISFIETESAYPSFCALAELSHEGDQFWQYCESVIGKNAMQEIYKFFNTTVFNPYENQTRGV